jgi:hypothetical protein
MILDTADIFNDYGLNMLFRASIKALLPRTGLLNDIDNAQKTISWRLAQIGGFIPLQRKKLFCNNVFLIFIIYFAVILNYKKEIIMSDI